MNDITKEIHAETKEVNVKVEDSGLNKEFDKNSVNILSIGRLHEQKGFDMAIKASAIMKSKGLDFKWFVIGSGELESELKNQIKSDKINCYE